MRFHQALLVCAFVPALAIASQSLQSGSGSTNLPSGRFTRSVWRAEFRIHNFRFNNTYQNIASTTAFALRLSPGNTVVLTSWPDGSQACDLSLANRSDVIVRFQRDDGSSMLKGEMWNADGSAYAQSTCTLSSPSTTPADWGSITLGGFSGSLAYFRAYSTIVEMQTAPSYTFDGDLLDYELEGNGLDRANGKNVSLGSAVYAPTPVYPPAAVFGQYPASRTFKAGGSGVTLRADSSFSSTDNAKLTYQWTQISGPDGGSFTNSSGASTMFSSPNPGTYVLQLTVTDNLGNSSSKQVKYGGVAVDSSGLVVVPDPAVSYLLGPLTMWGTSPWPWFDLTERADADALLPYVTAYPDPGTPLSGTLTISTANGNMYAPSIATGSGTHFTSELSPGASIAVAWPTPDGTNGVWLANVASIVDDTHLQLDRSAFPRPMPIANVTASKIDFSQYGFWGASQGVSTNWNYYDVSLALYRLYYRTGIDDYLNAARTLADGWYHYAIDHGYNVQAPRNSSLQSIMIRAMDGHPEYWTGILYYMNYPLSWSSQFNQTTPIPPRSQIEPRENGYMLRWGALIAEVHPDAGIRTQWCQKIANAVTNVWPNTQDDLGNFEEDVYNENAGYPYKPYQGRFGSSPWRGTIALLGMQQAYDALIDPQGCNLPAVAQKTLPVITGFADFVHDYGTGSGRGQLYSVQYETFGQDPLGSAGFNRSSPNTTGTLSVTRGSPIVTGTGTNFTTVFAGVAGATEVANAVQAGIPVAEPTNYIGIPAGNGCNLVFRVASVQSDTQLTLSEPWPSTCPNATQVTSSVGWLATWEAQKNCGSRATYCEGGPTGDRSLTHDIHAAYLWTWQTTGAERYYVWARDSLGADYGGPAGGPGAVGRGAGPRADGKTGNFGDPLPACGSPPCGGYGPTAALGKSFGMNAGAGNATNAIAIFTISPPGGRPNPLRPRAIPHRR